jgi:prolyl-tRNA synthetase
MLLVTCPWCFETLELEVEPDEHGEMVQDCDICCRPWRVVVTRDPEGEISVTVDRA